MSNIYLGGTYTDVVTGFTGVAVGLVSYLTGCDQALLQPRCKADDASTKPESQWFDVTRLRVHADVLPVVIPAAGAAPGPDKPAPRY